MHPNPRRIIPIVLLLGLAGYGVWSWWNGRAVAAGPVQASGTIETTEVNVAPELGGRVSAVVAQEGDVVQAGDVLVQFDSTLLDAQRAQAEAALQAAQANYDSLAAGPATAQGQAATAGAELELLQAQQALKDLNDNAELSVAQAQLEAANATDDVFNAQRDLSGVQYPDIQDYQDALDDAQNQLAILHGDQTVNDIGGLGSAVQAAQDVVQNAQDRLGDVQTAEQGCGGCDPDRLNQAQDNLNGALNNLQTQQIQQQNAEISNSQAIRDAQTAVNDAQDHLNAALAGPNARDLAIAEAKLAVQQARLARAQDQLEQMGRGPDPDDLAAAEARVKAAEAALRASQEGASAEQLAAAQAQVEVAQAAVDAIDVQIAKLTLAAPVNGVVLTRSIQPGEVASPGATLFVLGQLDELTITVYVAEDVYGQISLGQTARVSVDSFPGQAFTGRVIHIADQAEFTPRNVQTESGRKTTVFAVKLAIDNTDGRLKPGMPADISFAEN